MQTVKDQFEKKTVIEGAGFNLCLMALMTFLWTIVAFIGLYGKLSSAALIIFLSICVFLVSKGLFLSSAARLLPEQEDGNEQKRDKKFNYIFIGEGVGILLGINIVNNIGHQDLDVPVIALITGLHFFPLAKILTRPVLYIVAGWSTLVALIGMVLILNNLMDVKGIMTFTGIGMALATAGYGFYTWLSVRDTAASLTEN